MPRRLRLCPPGIPVHIVQRGNNRQTIFTADAEFRAYANWLREAGEKYGVDIHAWVFMTNHVHLLVTPRARDSVSLSMQYVGRYYVRYFNARHQRTGTLFEGRFRSGVVRNGCHYLACQRYIELNPVRAGIVIDPADYGWSSYRAHALGRVPKMWTPHAEYLALGATVGARRAAYQRIVADEPSDAAIEEIRAVLAGVRRHRVERRPANSTGLGSE